MDHVAARDPEQPLLQVEPAQRMAVSVAHRILLEGFGKLWIAGNRCRQCGFVEKHRAAWRIRPAIFARWLRQWRATHHRPSVAASLRELITQLLPTDEDFDAFCLDCYPRVYRHFTAGMSRVAKCNRLIEAIEDSDLIDNLKGYSQSMSAFIK